VLLDAGDSPFDPLDRNRAAVEALARGGVAVAYVDGKMLHAKALVVDRKTVILGSSNWTSAAFESNVEADVVMTSTVAPRRFWPAWRRCRAARRRGRTPSGGWRCRRTCCRPRRWGRWCGGRTRAGWTCISISCGWDSRPGRSRPWTCPGRWRPWGTRTRAPWPTGGGCTKYSGGWAPTAWWKRKKPMARTRRCGRGPRRRRRRWPCPRPISPGGGTGG
jgi:phosphatidylserine/phosphatidylglycerophosphate/cardiolipin synthase-like enzyme